MFNKKQPARRRPGLRTPAPARPDLQYYRSDKQQQTKKRVEVIDQRRAGVLAHAQHLPLYISFIIIAVSLVYCSILGNKATVALPKAGGLYAREYYEQQTGNVLNQSIFNHSKFTFDSRAFKAKVTEAVPDATDVTVSIPLIGRRPVIGLTLAQPLYLFSTNHKQYIVGDNGVVLADAASIDDKSKIDNLLVIQEDVPLKLTVGKPVLLLTDIAFMQTVVTEMEHAKLTVTSLTLPQGANEVYAHIDTLTYIVKFASSGDARQQVGAYLATRNNLGETIPNEYIDVRIGERVYVK